MKDKRKIMRLKDDFMRDLNFSIMNGKVAKATNYLSEMKNPKNVVSTPTRSLLFLTLSFDLAQTRNCFRDRKWRAHQ